VSAIERPTHCVAGSRLTEQGYDLWKKKLCKPDFWPKLFVSHDDRCYFSYGDGPSLKGYREIWEADCPLRDQLGSVFSFCVETGVNMPRVSKRSVKRAAPKTKAAVKRTARKTKAAVKKTVRRAAPKTRAAVKRTVRKAAPRTAVKAAAAAPAPKKVTTAIAKPLTKVQLMTALAEATGVAKKDVVAVMDELGNVIERHIKKRGAGQFTLLGLMKIRTVRKPATKARKGRNPFTGEEIMIAAKPARTAVRVTPLMALKNMAGS
jgi:nucleoid DNA-binding protein